MQARNDHQQLTQSLKQEMHMRCDQHVTILAAVQTVVHQLAADADQLRTFLSFAYRQLHKLTRVLRELKSTPTADEPSSRASAGLLREYGAETSQIFEYCVGRLRTLQSHDLAKDNELSEGKLLAAELKRTVFMLENQLSECSLQIVEKNRKIDSLTSNLSSANEMVASHQQKIASLHTEIASKEAGQEVNSAELFRNNVLMQVELTRLHTELCYVRSTFDDRIAEECDKVKDGNKSVLELKRMIQDSENRTIKLQEEVTAAEAETNRQKILFTQLRQEASSLVQKAINEKKKHTSREGEYFNIFWPCDIYCMLCSL
jgi:type I site-specific restriction endonuclease